MAKIDLSTVENYSSMTPEEKVAFFEAYELPEVPKPDNTEADKLKAALSKANAEAASYKRELREKQTEQERAESERKEHEAAIEEELKTLRRDKTVSGYQAQYLSLGYSKELALKAAEAMADGDAATSLACQQEFLEAKTKELEAAALNKQPTLTPGAPPSGKSAEELAEDKMRKYFGLPSRNKT